MAAGSHHVLRFEPDASQAWAVVARSAEAVLPDARPLQADLDARGDGGHLVLLAGPDSPRYLHGVLGDGVEATRLLWLERHGLALMRELVLPVPDVLEDIAPRLVLPQQNGLALRVFDAGAAWAEVASIALPARVAMTAALPGGQGVAALLDDGRMFGVGVGSRRPACGRLLAFAAMRQRGRQGRSPALRQP